MTQIVILGAGFGGLWAAEKLANHPAQTLILDKNNYHTFLPLLYQVAAAELEPERIAQPVRSIVRQRGQVRFAMHEVVGVDLAAQTVQTAAGETLPYDYLLIALGSTNHYFGLPGAEEHSFTLKSIEEGIDLRNHILRCVEQAAREPDAAVRRHLLTFVIIGGGPTGVEYAGALAELLYQPLDKDFPELNLRQEAQVVLVEAADGLLRGIGGGDYALQRLQRMGVDVRLQTQVSAIQADGVVLGDGQLIPTASPVWTAGVQGVPLAQLDLPRVRGGRIPVRPTLQAEGYDNVFVVGDLAYLEQDGQMLPGVAQVAMQGGQHAARNILRHMAGQPLLDFRYKDKGAMATIGRNAAVANIGGRQFTGFVAWVLWLVIHIFFLIGFRNRLGVLTNWAWNYLFYERVVRLILPTKAKKAD